MGMGSARKNKDKAGGTVPNGEERRDHDPGTGRFARGNQVAKGRKRPFAARRAEITRKLMEVPDEDIEAVIDKLVECAKRGEGWAIKELLTRWMGAAHRYESRKAYEHDFLEHEEEIEQKDDVRPDDGGPTFEEFLEDALSGPGPARDMLYSIVQEICDGDL